MVSIVIPTFPLPFETSCVSLARYAEIIGHPSCAFWGVFDEDEEWGCNNIWSENNRRTTAHYLAEAQDEIEQITRYPLCPAWFTDERQSYAYPVHTDWGRVIEAGIEATEVIQAGATVNYATEPATIGPLATTVTDASEVRVFYPDSEREITPQSVQISGGNLTIYIPRCRMVAANVVDNPEIGLSIDDLSNFLSTVDLTRIYNDPSTNAELVWPHRCNGNCSSQGCTEFTQDACMYVRNGKTGAIDTWPASFSGGTWTKATVTCCAGQPQIVRLNYRAGLNPLTPQAEDAVVRLAHSKMPDEMCGCEGWSRLWRRDRHTPEIMTAERLNCPFGLSDGSWIAWRFAQAIRLVRGFVL